MTTRMILLPLPLFHQICTKILQKMQIWKRLQLTGDCVTMTDLERCVYRIILVCTQTRKHTAHLVTGPAVPGVAVSQKMVQMIPHLFIPRPDPEINRRTVLLI